MPSEAQAVELTRRHQRLLNRISTRAGNLTAAEWMALRSWDERDIARFVEATASVFEAAKLASVNASAGYYAALADIPIPAVSAARLLVAPDVRAPFTTYWHLLGEQTPWNEAIVSGRERARSTAQDLVTSTSRRTGDAVLGQRVVGWRRVLTGNSCKWCATVATQRYRTAESADFGHHHCDCSVAPILGDVDPGQVINAERVETVAQTLPVRV